MDLHRGKGTTTLSGTVADQSALHGILVRIRDLNLPLILVKRERHLDKKHE
jgi:hypothetical protein